MNLAGCFRVQVIGALGVLLLLGPPAKAEKVWTNSASGLWRDGTNWSGHAAPDITSFIEITNDVTKTITIDALTDPTNLTVQTLTISAPPGATNFLLLSSVNVTNPLVFQTGLEMRDGAAIIITNSALQTLLTNDHVNIDGLLRLDSGWIDFGDITVTARVGRVTSGTFTINGGTVYAGAMTVGGLTNSTGFLNLNGGTLLVSAFLSSGRNLSTTGSVSITGGQLIVTNDDTRVGDEGWGEMVISNATANLNNLQVGRDNVGILTLQTGAVVQLMFDSVLGHFAGGTGVVSVVGGKLSAPGQKIYVDRGGYGELDLSNGLVQAASLLVAADTTNSAGATGMASISGGALIVSTNFQVGSATYSTGQVSVAGGSVVVTNAAGSAVMSVPSGTLVLQGGAITANTLLVTNGAGQFVFNAGTLTTSGASVANGAPFVVGDGISAATYSMNGGTHSFPNGLVISKNATLAGCGTIIGNIVNNGTIATNCGAGLIAPLVTSGPTNETVVLGGSTTFAVAATGTAPLAFQWQAHGTNLAGATTSSLSLSNIQLSEAGTYAVIVTNQAGSMTSTSATLRVLAPVGISLQSQNAGTNAFSVSSVSGLLYTLQYKNLLSEPTWTDLLPSTVGTGGTIVLRDTTATVPQRFYRVHIQ